MEFNISSFVTSESDSHIQDLTNTDYECLRRFNQSETHYKDNVQYLTVEQTEKYGYSNGQVFLLTLFLPLLLTFGILGNCAFMFVAVRVKYMHTITNRYLINLAIADIVFLGSAIGPKIWKYHHSPLYGDDSPLGSHGCVWTYFLVDTSYFASLAFTTLVSLDRYVAVCRPQDRATGIKQRSKEMILGSWILACILAGSLTPANSRLVFYCYKWAPVAPFNNWPSTIRYCQPLKQWMTRYSFGLQTVPFFVTFVINIVFYLSIIRGLQNSIRRLSQKGFQRNRNHKLKNQVAKMLVLNGVVFFCCLAPFEFISIFYMIASSRNGFIISNPTTRTYITLIARIMSYINSTINPIIYTAMCDRYIQAFKYAFAEPINCLLLKYCRREACDNT